MNIPLWLQIVLVIVATCQLTETFRHGAILERLRAWIESRGPFWEELVGCGFCFSHWAAAIAVLLLLGHNLMAHAGYVYSPFLLMLIWLTAIRGANLLNDLTKQWSRSPSTGEIDLPPLEMHDEEIEDLKDARPNRDGKPTTGSEPD